MLIPALAISIAFVATAPAMGEEPEALTYQMAQAQLVDQSDAIAAQEANVRGRELQEGATKTLRRPDVDLEAQLLEYQTTLILPLGPLAPVAEQFGIPDELEFQQRRTARRPIVSASVPIYAGGRISATQSGAHAQVLEAQAQLELAINDQLHSLAQAYFGQLLAEKALVIRRDVVVGLEQHVSDAQKLEREGFISRAQMLQAEVARDEARRELEKAIADLATANAVLAGLLREPAGVRPTSALAVSPSPIPPLAAFLPEAGSIHPRLAQVDAKIEQAEAAVAIQRSELRPTVYGFGQYNFDRENSLITDPDWTIGVGIKYKIMSGKGRRQLVDAARQDVLQAEAGRREAETQIRIGVSKAWNETEAARRRFELYESAIESAEENLRLQRLSYREQLATSLDVVDAELGLSRARIEQANAAYEYIQALADLLHVSGRMIELPQYLAQSTRVIP